MMQKRLGWRFNQRHSIPDWIEHRYDGLRYARRILVTRPQNLIGYWPMWEGNGVVSFDNSPNGYDGAYTGVTLAQPGIGDGRYSAFFDGVNDFNNIYSAGLANNNLLLNPGFETPGGGGADIWANWVETAGDGALANEIVIVHQGVDAARITSGVTSNTKVAQTIAVVAGQQYRLRIWTRGDGVNAGRYGIFDVTNGVDIVAPTSTGVTAAVWTMFDVEFTVPAGSISVRIDLWCPPVNGGICYFDATEVRRTNGFLGDRGTIIVSARVFNAGVWTDGAIRNAIRIGGATDYVVIRRSVINNQLDWGYVAGGVGNWFGGGGLTDIDFMWLAITWDKSAGATGQVLAFKDGLQIGVTGVGLGTWIDNLIATGVNIGSLDHIPQQVWHGYEAHGALWNVALTPAEMAFVGTPL